MSFSFLLLGDIQGSIDETISNKVISGSGSAYGPDIAMNRNGDLFVLYTETHEDDHTNENDIILKRSTDGGLNFDQRVYVNDVLENDQYGGKIAITDNGIIHVIYQDSNIYNLVYCRSEDNGETFTTPVQVTDERIYSTLYEFGAYGENLYILTRLQGGVDYGYYFIRSLNNGTSFEDPVLMGTSNGYEIDINSKGNLHIMEWQHSGSDSYLIVSRNNGTTFNDKVKICTKNSIEGFTRLRSDPHDNLFATWVRGNGDRIYFSIFNEIEEKFSEAIMVLENFGGVLRDSIIEFDDWGGIYILFMKYTSSGQFLNLIYSSDHGRTFSDPVMVNNRFTSNINDRSILFDREDNIFILWSEYYNSESSIYISGYQLPNHPPVIEKVIPILEIDEDGLEEGTFIDCSEHFDDDKGKDNLYFQMMELDPSDVILAEFEGDRLIFTDLEENWYGDIMVSISCSDLGDDGIMGNDDDRTIFYHGIQVRISPVDDPPRIIQFGNFSLDDSGLEITIDEDTMNIWNISYEEMDGEEVSFQFNSTDPMCRFCEENLSISFDPLNENVGIVDLVLTITDENGTFSEYDIRLEVVNINDPPLVMKKDLSIRKTEDIDYSFNELHEWITDPDGDPLTFDFLTNDKVDIVKVNDTYMIISNKDHYGMETVEVLISDGEVSINVTFNIKIVQVNDPPEVSGIKVMNGKLKEGEKQVLTCDAFDPEESNETLIYIWYLDGIQIGSGKEIEVDLKEGEHEITVEVIDYQMESTTFTTQIEVSPGDDPFLNTIVLILIPVISLMVISLILFLILKPWKGKEVDKETVQTPDKQAEPSELMKEIFDGDKGSIDQQ
jgi:hypothetical protein